MAATEDKAGNGADPASDQEGANKLTDPDRDGNTPTLPRIAAFYADQGMRKPAFLKAVGAAKVKAFNVDDRREALEGIGTLDPTLSRTVSLLGKDRDAVGKWVTEVTVAVLSEQIPGIASSDPRSASALLERILQTSTEDLRSKNKQRKLRAINLLQLALNWLIEQRNLDPIDALLKLRRQAFNERNTNSARYKVEVAKLLTKSHINQLKAPSIVAAYFEEALDEARADRFNAHETNTKLKEKNAELESGLRASEFDRASLADQVSELEKQLREEKELRRLEASRQAARMQRFLRERLRPHLSDARDALDFEPPHTDGTRERIEMALAAVNGELDRSDE